MNARYLFDSDSLSLYFQTHPRIVANLVAHLSDTVLVSAITIEEILSGWYTSLRQARKPHQVVLAYDRLTSTMNELRAWEVLSFSADAMDRYDKLKKLRLNVAKQDLRISAIALEWGGTVVTRNLSDFQRVPGLTCEDWSA